VLTEDRCSLAQSDDVAGLLAVVATQCGVLVAVLGLGNIVACTR
jgi:hypothetical protein